MSSFNSPVCSCWQTPRPHRRAGYPCIALDREGSGNPGRCWCSVAIRSPWSKHRAPCHTGGGREQHQYNAKQIITWMNSWNTGLVHARRNNRSFYLVDVFTVGAISTQTSRARATFPGSIWRAVAVHSPKAWVRQTAICKRFRRREWIQARDKNLNIAGLHLCVSLNDSTLIYDGYYLG